MVVSGSLSKTAANKEAGARSQVSNIVNAAIVLLTLAFLAPLFTNLPEATLAAIVIHAVWRSADPRRLLPFLKIRPFEFWIALIVLAAVLLIGEIQAVILGVVVSLLFLVYRISFPRTTQLGRVRDAEVLIDSDLNPDARPIPGVVVYRFEAPLIYANAEAFSRDAHALLSAADPPAEMLIIDGEVISDVDTTGAESLVSLVSELRASGIEVRLARVHQTVYEALERGDFIEEIGTESFLPSLLDALPPEV